MPSLAFLPRQFRCKRFKPAGDGQRHGSRLPNQARQRRCAVVPSLLTLQLPMLSQPGCQRICKFCGRSETATSQTLSKLNRT